MSFVFSPRKIVRQGTGAFLALSVLVGGGLLMPGFAQPQVGPMPPQAKPAQPNPLGKALAKMMKKKDGDADETPDIDGEQTTEEGAAADDKANKMIDPSAEMAPDPTRRPPMLNQPPLTNAKIDPMEVDSANPPAIDHPRLDDPTNPLGLTDAANRLQKLSALVDAKRFAEAKAMLTPLRQSLVELTEAHIGLYKTLNQVPSARAQAELEKELALQFAQLRDRVMIESARIYISEKDYSRAVKELTEVVKSQPRSKIGLRSYELLQEIGFTEKLQLSQ